MLGLHLEGEAPDATKGTQGFSGDQETQRPAPHESHRGMRLEYISLINLNFAKEKYFVTYSVAYRMRNRGTGPSVCTGIF